MPPATGGITPWGRRPGRGDQQSQQPTVPTNTTVNSRLLPQPTVVSATVQRAGDWWAIKLTESGGGAGQRRKVNSCRAGAAAG